MKKESSKDSPASFPGMDVYVLHKFIDALKQFFGFNLIQHCIYLLPDVLHHRITPFFVASYHGMGAVVKTSGADFRNSGNRQGNRLFLLPL